MAIPGNGFSMNFGSIGQQVNMDDLEKLDIFKSPQTFTANIQIPEGLPKHLLLDKEQAITVRYKLSKRQQKRRKRNLRRSKRRSDGTTCKRSRKGLVRPLSWVYQIERAALIDYETTGNSMSLNYEIK